MNNPSPMVSESPETISAGDNAHLQITKIIQKDRLLALLLALSVMVNVWCGLQIRDDTMEQRLKQYELDHFKTTEFADLQGQVKLHDKLLDMQCRRP